MARCLRTSGVMIYKHLFTWRPAITHARCFHGISILKPIRKHTSPFDFHQVVRNFTRSMSHESCSPPDGLAVSSATLHHRTRRLMTSWQDGGSREFPFVWLRDNCQCESCFNHSAEARNALLRDLDPHSVPRDVTVTEKAVTLTWEDGHVSPYPLEWLDARSFTSTARYRRRTWYTEPSHMWGKELQGHIPVVSFNDLLQDDHSLYEWIKTLEQVGLHLVTGALQEPGQLHKIGQRVAYLRKTAYGETFRVYSKENPNNVAFTPVALSLHTDLAYYHYQPGMQMLHCVKQAPAEGGENILSDGFNAAVQLKEQFPEYFRLLCEYALDFYDVGEDVNGHFHTLTQERVIQMDAAGNLYRINYSQHGRDSFMNDLPLEVVEPLYFALIKFEDLLMHDDNLVKYKMDPGDILCFHNFRVLHGRSAYTCTGPSTRHLEGGYIDWDELGSKKRVLRKALGTKGF